MNARVSVLTYHSMNIAGETRALNDHVALSADLCALAAAEVDVITLSDAIRGALGTAHASQNPSVAITFDDGSWFDWHDLLHPVFGMQRSFANVLRDFGRTTGRFAHATSFVIVSPVARDHLDRSCMIGKGWWGNDWWQAAEREGLISIESHSWDHNHDTLPRALRLDELGGRFDHVSSDLEAREQIARSIDWLDEHVGYRRPRLFAWPYGQSSDYLRSEWMPLHGEQLGIAAAFGTRPAPLTSGSNRWDLPRFVCGRDWRTADELLRLVGARGTSSP